MASEYKTSALQLLVERGEARADRDRWRAEAMAARGLLNKAGFPESNYVLDGPFKERTAYVFARKANEASEEAKDGE